MNRGGLICLAHAMSEVRTLSNAVAKITEHIDVLLAFYVYPAEHWIPLRTTNPIESTFATVRLRQRVTKGPGSRAAGVAMAFKLIESAQARWRAVNAPHLVALVRPGARIEKGNSSNDPTNLEVISKSRETLTLIVEFGVTWSL
jgi:hypothetical protein